MGPLDLLTLTILTVVGVQLVQAARHSVSARSHVVRIMRGLGRRQFLHAVPVLIAVMAALIALLQVPGLSFGWWTAIGGVGNPVFGASEHGLEGDSSILLSGLFVALLLVSLPLLVEREEMIFRRGAEQRGAFANTGFALLFGLLHVLVGIPIAAGLAISIGGGYFTHVYLRAFRETRSQAEALLASTRAHLAYNLVLISLVVVTLVLTLAV
ncbi:MAG TPA: hypothetical protein VI916_01160 [Acidimicrobiia bacterium]|nr:hypothetical protein [Acidimicrobiia bacterium]